MTGVLEGQWQLNGMIFVGIFVILVISNGGMYIIYISLFINSNLPTIYITNWLEMERYLEWSVMLKLGILYIVVRVGGIVLYVLDTLEWEDSCCLFCTLCCCIRVGGSMLLVNYCLLLKYISFEKDLDINIHCDLTTFTT